MILLIACVPSLKPPTIVDNPGHDFDADGYTERDGDCDDEDPEIQPGSGLCGERSTGSADGGLTFTDGGAFGAALDVGGDEDKDGWRELVIGNPTFVNGGREVGGAGLYAGPWDRTRSTEDLPWMNSEEDAAGQAVAYIGDYRGDGRSSWALGLPLADAGRAEGIYFVVTGDNEIVDGASGRFSGWELGAAIERVDDLDHDERPEIFVGAPGGALAFVHTPDLVDYAGFAGPDDSRAGQALLARDLEGDGEIDLLIGAPAGDGTVYLVEGPVGWEPELDLELNAERLEGAGAEALGSALTVVDVDGDGRLDVVAGAPGARGGAGEAHVYLSPVQSGADPWAVLEGASGGAGAALAAPVDAAGRARVAVGAPDSGGGTVYVFAIPEAGTWELTEAEGVLRGEAGGQRLGATLEAADLDDDGAEDLVAGAPGTSGGGAVYFFLGNHP